MKFAEKPRVRAKDGSSGKRGHGKLANQIVDDGSDGGDPLTTTPILVSMSDLLVATKGTLFTCLGLGSCVAVCAYDSSAKVGAMAHVMLPDSKGKNEPGRPAKFADLTIPHLLEAMSSSGAASGRLQLAIAGGAHVMRFETSPNGLSIGERNALVLEENAEKHHVACVAKDVGGTEGRSISLSTETGEVRVWTLTGGERLMCIFK